MQPMIIVSRLRTLWGVSLYSNAFYLIVKSAVDALAGIVFWILAANSYSPEDVGLATATIAAISLLGFCSLLGMNWGLMRFLPSSGDRSHDTINSCLTVTGLAALAFSLIFLGGLGIWSPALVLLRQDLATGGAFVAITIAFTLYGMIAGPFVARRKAGFALAMGLIFSLSRLGLLIPLVTLLPRFGILAAWGIGLMVTIAGAILFFLPRVETGYRPLPTLKRGVINDIIHFSGTNYAVELLMVVPIFVLPLMVVNILGAESNAYFYVAWTMGGLLTFIAAGFSVSLFAEGAYNEDGLSQDIKKSLRAMVLLIPAVLIVFLIGDKVLLLFGSAYSQNATRLLWVLALSSFPITINHFYFAIRRVQKQMKGVVGLNAFIAVSTLMLAYFLLPRMGILGAGVAWLATQGVVALVAGYFIRAELQRSA